MHPDDTQTPNSQPHETDRSQTHPVSDHLNQTLRQLLAAACKHPLKSWQRRDTLDEVYRLVMTSGKLWKDSTPEYSDALQQMWEYCCHHPQDYDSTVKEVITWLNDELKKRLKRLRDQKYRQRRRRISASQITEEPTLDFWQNCAANPDIEPVLDMWQETLNWVRTDPDDVLRNTRFRKRADINAQTLFLQRFPAETPWSAIAAHFNLTPAEAKDLPKFYHRRCKPLLREFGVSQGYIEGD